MCISLVFVAFDPFALGVRILEAKMVRCVLASFEDDLPRFQGPLTFGGDREDKGSSITGLWFHRQVKPTLMIFLATVPNMMFVIALQYFRLHPVYVCRQCRINFL